MLDENDSSTRRRESDPTFVLSYQSSSLSEVYAGHGMLARAAYLVRSLPGGAPRRVVVATDETVFGMHGQALVQALRDADLETLAIRMPAGEQEKTLANVTTALGRLADHGIDRHDVMLALGGGVPGDLFGFVASAYMRGIRLVQIPTSLVAQVDSSIGGKVGVDLPEGKNLVGAFKQPNRVIIDYDLLQTLPYDEWVSGTAEVAKHGVIADVALFTWLETHAEEWRTRSTELGAILAAAIGVKARVVQEDEHENGVRMHLNYGHTPGHAVEAVAGYRGVRHGEAVAWGMALEARMAAEVGLSDETFVRRQDALLQALGLLRPLPPLDADAVLGRLLLDKKVRAGRVRWILPGHGPGSVTVRDDIPAPLVRRLVTHLVEGTLLAG